MNRYLVIAALASSAAIGSVVTADVYEKITHPTRFTSHFSTGTAGSVDTNVPTDYESVPTDYASVNYHCF